MDSLKHCIAFAKSKLHLVSHFFAAQGLSMAGNLLYGFLCVRLLPPSEYAKFVIVFGVQGTLLILMDASFSNTLMPLIGERVDNRQLIADYVASFRQLSIRAYVLVACGSIVFFPLLVKNRHWTATTVAVMVLIVLISTWFVRIGSAYGAVMILLRDRTAWYNTQLISSFGTLILLGIFWCSGWLGPFQAILINVAGIIFIAGRCFYRSQSILGTGGIVSVEKKRAIVRLALPNIPASIFYALQGQISLFLITYFGLTIGVASVGALGRIGQIFAIFLQANGLLVEPYFAKLPNAHLKRNYAIAFGLAATVFLSMVLLTMRFPQVFLWALGHQYSNLGFEIKLAVATSAISCLSGFLWCIHSARRFVYWWNVILAIVLTISVQVIFFTKVNMGSVRGVLWLNFATNIVLLSINILSGILGFWKGPREVEKPSTVLASSTVSEAESVLTLSSIESGNTPDNALPRITKPKGIEG